MDITKKIKQIKSIRLEMQILASIILLIAYTATSNVFGSVLSIYITVIFSIITIIIGVYYHLRSKRTSKLPASLLVSIITVALFLIEEIILKDKFANTVTTIIYIAAFIVIAATIFIKEKRYNIDLKLIDQSMKSYQQNRIFLTLILGVISVISILVVYRHNYTIESELPYFIASYTLMSLVCFILHNEFILTYIKIDDILKDGILGIFDSSGNMIDVAINNKDRIKVSTYNRELFIFKARTICCNDSGILLTKTEIGDETYYDTPFSTLCKYNNEVDKLPQKSIRWQKYDLTQIANYTQKGVKVSTINRVYMVDDNNSIIENNKIYFTPINVAQQYINNNLIAPQLKDELAMINTADFPAIARLKLGNK